MSGAAALPALQPCNRRKADIERLASEIRRQVDERLALAPDGDLRLVVEALGGRIEYCDVLDWSAEDGSIEIHGKHNFVIRLPQETTETRDRFTIAHELAHYFLHANQGERPGKATRSLMDQRVEWEANWFAAEFLMPEDAFKAARKAAHGDLRAVARHFGVSVAAARVRHSVLNGD